MFLDKTRHCVIEIRKSNVNNELVIKIVCASESSELKLLTEKPEKSLRFCFFDFNFLSKVWETQNCEKWSLMSETIIITTGDILASTLLVKILLIKVAEPLCTRVGLSIVGVNEKLGRESKNS